MPISIVVGGQFGSEGKGKVAHWLAKHQQAKYSIRVGGPNSGHTAFRDGEAYALRQLPTAALWPDVVAVIPPGAYIDVQVLLKEIEEVGIPKERLIIHPNAVVIEEWMRTEEVNANLIERISSTGQGVGAAVAHRAFRNPDLRFAESEDRLSDYISHDLAFRLEKDLRHGSRLIIEGTQGFGLSILHGGEYPFATSRDTSAAGALSEAGLSPMDVDCIALVIRSYPIRVGGNSGVLPNETSWECVGRSAGASTHLCEYTTVTDKLRRVAEFDESVVRKAIANNRPTHICLNHADYFDYGVHDLPVVSEKMLQRLRMVERAIDAKVDLIGTGSNTTFLAPSRNQLISVA